MMISLRPLSDNSNTAVISVLGSIYYLFFIQFEFFFILGRSDFLLKPRYLCIILKFGILFKFLGKESGSGEWAASLLPEEAKFQVPTWLPLSLSWGGLLITVRWEWKSCFTFSLYSWLGGVEEPYYCFPLGLTLCWRSGWDERFVCSRSPLRPPQKEGAEASHTHWVGVEIHVVSTDTEWEGWKFHLHTQFSLTLVQWEGGRWRLVLLPLQRGDSANLCFLLSFHWEWG